MGSIVKAFTGGVSKVASVVANVAPFFKTIAPWISYINMAIMVISWIKKPDQPDTQTWTDKQSKTPKVF